MSLFFIYIVVILIYIFWSCGGFDRPSQYLKKMVAELVEAINDDEEE